MPYTFHLLPYALPLFHDCVYFFEGISEFFGKFFYCGFSEDPQLATLHTERHNIDVTVR